MSAAVCAGRLGAQQGGGGAHRSRQRSEIDSEETAATRDDGGVREAETDHTA